MSKELEALYRLATRNSGNHRSIEEVDKDFKIIEKALKDYESIDNANPSEALEHFINYCENHTTGYTPDTDREDMEYVQQALLKAEQYKKKATCWDIVIKKYIDLNWLKYCIKENKDYDYYIKHLDDDEDTLSEEEFNLLKESVGE